MIVSVCKSPPSPSPFRLFFLALRDETSLRDDSLTTTPSEESSQLLARTTDRPRWIPIYRQR